MKSESSYEGNGGKTWKKNAGKWIRGLKESKIIYSECNEAEKTGRSKLESERQKWRFWA